MASYPRSNTSSTELSLSSSAQALFYASKPPSNRSTSEWQHQQPASHFDDTDDDSSARWDDAPEQSRWSSATGSQRASSRSNSYSYSRSKFSDGESSNYNSDEDRYGGPDGQDRTSGYSSDKADHASLSGASSYATAPTSADILDSAAFLDDRPPRFYRQSAREAEAYRHLSMRRPSPIPSISSNDVPAPPRSPFLHADAAAPTPNSQPPSNNNNSQPPSSPIPSPTLPLNIKKKPGTSPASPNFGAFAVPLPPMGSASGGMTSGPSSLVDNDSAMNNTLLYGAREPVGGVRASNATSSGTRSSNAYSSSSAGIYRTSMLSSSQTRSSSQPRTSPSPLPATVMRQPSSDHIAAVAQRLPHPHPHPSQDTSESEGSEQEHEHEEERAAAAGSDSDDNVPLARRLPNALKAQQSIRAKDKEDRQRRRAERAARKAVAMPALPGQPRAVSAPQHQNGASSSNTGNLKHRQASQPLAAHAMSPPRAHVTLPPSAFHVHSHSHSHSTDFADDLTQRLAQVQTASPDEDTAHFGVALAIDNTGAGRVPMRSPPATHQKTFPRGPPPADAFIAHEELQIRRRSSQPLQTHSRHASVSSQRSGSIRERGGDNFKDLRESSPALGGASPDAKLRAYSLSRTGSISARGTHVIPPPRPESRSRPPSPPPMPAASRSGPASPSVAPVALPPPVQSSSQQPSRRPTTATVKRPGTADGERHRPPPLGDLRRPTTADRDARAPMAMSASRPASPVMRPPSPSMSGMTPDERLKQLAMGRRGRSTSISNTHAPRQPSAPPPHLPPLKHQESFQRPSPPAQVDFPSPSQAQSHQRISPPHENNGVPPPLGLSHSQPPSSARPQDADFGIRPPSPSMATLTPDERLRQIAARARARVPTAQPTPAPAVGGFRKRAMSLGRPTGKDDGAAPMRSKTLVKPSRMPPVPQSPMPMNFISSRPHDRPVVVLDTLGATQKVLSADVQPGMPARLVVAQLDAELAGGAQGWMLYEICNDLGLERPIREFEIPAECCARWPAEGNTFAVRQTRLSRVLAQSALPSVPPAHGAYVEFEVKRGKWSKRWLELREHSLWVSKREHAKDAVLLCSLSNFDVYSATRPVVKPPRYAFTLRSTDDLNMFENPADSMHSFCAPDAREGDRWVERIMIARSCVLAQERVALFRNAQPQPQTNGSASGPRQRPPVAPLLNVRALAQAAGVLSPSPVSARPDNMKFEPGSLLARAAAAERV